MDVLRLAEEASLFARLSRHPRLEGRIERLLDLVEGRGGRCVKPMLPSSR